MSIKEIVKDMKEMKNSGISRSEIYNKYKEEKIGKKRIAMMVAALPDKKISEQYKTLKIINIIVVVLMSIPFTKAVMFYTSEQYLDTLMTYFCIASIGIIFPILNAVSFYLERSQAYAQFIFLTSFFLIMSILVINKEYYDVSIIYILGFAYTLISVILTSYTKLKLFPALTFLGSVKKDSDGEPIFD